jgi:flagellar biosynthesis/type III secretory pathway M-ring protein FliF/YscJ
MMRGGKRGQSAEAQHALPAVDTYAGLPGGPAAAATIAEAARLPALLPSRTEVLLNQLQDNSRNNPEAWANVLRGWLSEEEPS